MVNYITRATLDMLLLRKGPQDLPARRELMMAIIGVYVLISTFAYLSVTDMNVPVSFMQAVSSLAYLAGFVWVVLMVAGKRARFQQSFMGFTMTAAVFNILEVGPLLDLMPHLLKMQEIVQQAQNTGSEISPEQIEAIQIPGLSMVLLLFVYMWRLLVMAHIFHHALEISRGRAMAVTLLFPTAVMFLVLVLR